MDPLNFEMLVTSQVIVPPTDNNHSTGSKVCFNLLEPCSILFLVSFDFAFVETSDLKVVLVCDIWCQSCKGTSHILFSTFIYSYLLSSFSPYKVEDIRFPLRPHDHFCHTSCPIHCHGHNFNENILTPQNDSFEAILWFCGSQLQKYGELDVLITILGWEIFWICQVCFLPFTSKKGFWVGTNFVPPAYVRDYVIFQIWKTVAQGK